MKRRTEKVYKVRVELDAETNRQADLLCQLYGGITFEQLIHRLLKKAMAKKGGAL